MIPPPLIYRIPLTSLWIICKFDSTIWFYHEQFQCQEKLTRLTNWF